MTTINNTNEYFTPLDTVTPVQAESSYSTPTIVTGTRGYTGTLEYSRSAAAIVSETYVVTTKK